MHKVKRQCKFYENQVQHLEISDKFDITFLAESYLKVAFQGDWTKSAGVLNRDISTDKFLNSKINLGVKEQMFAYYKMLNLALF